MRAVATVLPSLRALGAARKLLKFANRSHRFALVAAEQALADAGIRPTEATEDDTMIATLEARAEGQRRPVGGAHATFGVRR
jgi:3-oxoacyl-(acyl-carrier-protein) synthase